MGAKGSNRCQVLKHATISVYAEIQCFLFNGRIINPSVPEFFFQSIFER